MMRAICISPISSKRRRLLTLFLFVLTCAGYGFGQAANLVVDSLQGEVTQNEVDTFISYMNGGVGGAALPTTSQGDNLAYGTPGLTLEALNYMYRITGDIPSMTNEQMQLLNLAIVWSDRFILIRNDQPMGPHQVMWTGNVDPVWITKTATGAGYAGSENGDTAGHIVYTALNILQTPSIWNQTIPDGDPNGFGTTYLARAQTYINMMEDTTQNYFTKYFINPTTYQVIAPTSAAWVVFNENMDAWNRQFLFTNDYLRLAQCHAILGDNPALVDFYTKIVKTTADGFVANAVLVTGSGGEAAYDWGYGNQGDLMGQITGESSSHASYDMQGMARVFEAGPQFTSASLETMERYSNTLEYVLFNYAAYSQNQTTAYYKTIDAGLPPVPAGTSTQDYLYPQFYLMTPYNTLFWAPAAYGASPTVHNNYHNNPYMVTGILYSKHWVYTHPQTMISVAANSQTVPAGGTATYNITTSGSSDVALSVSGLPAGATASFNPAVVTGGSGSSTLTVTMPAGSVNGSQLFTLTGTSGGSVQNLGLSVVTTAPDFTIGVSSTSTVTAGANGSFTVTIKPSNGFTGDVALSADSFLAPAGTAFSFNPQVVTGGSGTSVVTAATSAASTPGGQWPVGFIAKSGNTTHEGYSRLTVKGAAQSINFPAISNVTYGTAPILLQATAGSSLPVTYTVTGPAVVTGSPTLQGQSLTITGAGTVTVTASESGDTYYAAATPVTQSFTVAPAVLTVTAQNASMARGSVVPALTANITGFVNGDTWSVVAGTPSLTTTATSSSPVGVYPIVVGPGTLATTNYTFNYVNGVLDIYGTGRR